MKKNITLKIIVLTLLLSLNSCKSARIVSISKSQTAQHDRKKEVIHLTSNGDIKIKSKEAIKLNSLGIKQGKTGNYELARNSFQEALRIEGDNAAIYGNLALVEMLSENFDLATNYFLKSIDTDPSYFSSYMNLGVNYYRDKKYNQAIEIYSRVLNMTSDDDSLFGFVHVNMSHSYLELKKCKKAKVSIDTGKKIIGDNAYEIIPNLDKDEKEILKCLKNK